MNNAAQIPYHTASMSAEARAPALVAAVAIPPQLPQSPAQSQLVAEAAQLTAPPILTAGQAVQLTAPSGQPLGIGVSESRDGQYKLQVDYFDDPAVAHTCHGLLQPLMVLESLNGQDMKGLPYVDQLVLLADSMASSEPRCTRWIASQENISRSETRFRLFTDSNRGTIKKI
jgi:hypothetical protein